MFKCSITHSMETSNGAASVCFYLHFQICVWYFIKVSLFVYNILCVLHICMRTHSDLLYSPCHRYMLRIDRHRRAHNTCPIHSRERGRERRINITLLFFVFFFLFEIFSSCYPFRFSFGFVGHMFVYVYQ